MSSDQIRATTSTSSTSTQPDQDHENDEQIMSIRDIHALTPPRPPPPLPPRRREPWETSSHHSSLSMASNEGSENFTTISREFNALVLAGSAVENNRNENDHGSGNNGNFNLGMIGEEEETNPLAIVPDTNPMASPRRQSVASVTGGSSSMNSNHSEVSVQRVKKEEVETKITAWQNAKIAKINNRFKREDAIINGWENEQIQKSSSWMKKIERKLEEKRARALEKMQNDTAKAHRKAEERRASAEARRGTKVAKVYEIAKLMKAVGRAPSKRSFF